RYTGAVARAYRWLAVGAALYCSGLVVQGVLGGTLNPAPGLSFTDLPPLLALAAVAVGIALLTMAEREVTSSPQEGSAGSVLPGIADGYGVAGQLMPVVAALLLGAAPWRMTEGFGTSWARRTASAAAATVIAVLAASLATVVVIANGLAGAPASGIALVVAGGAGVLVLAARIFMLVRENLAVTGIWRESSRSLRDLANRTSDVVLVCALDGVVKYASPAGEAYGSPPATLT